MSATLNAKLLKHPALAEHCFNENAETIRKQQEIIGNVATNLIALLNAAEDITVEITESILRCPKCDRGDTNPNRVCIYCRVPRETTPRRVTVQLVDIGIHEVNRQELGILLATYALREKPITVRCEDCGDRNSECTCGGGR